MGVAPKWRYGELLDGLIIGRRQSHRKLYARIRCLNSSATDRECERAEHGNEETDARCENRAIRVGSSLMQKMWVGERSSQMCPRRKGGEPSCRLPTLPEPSDAPRQKVRSPATLAAPRCAKRRLRPPASTLVAGVIIAHCGVRKETRFRHSFTHLVANRRR